MSALILGGGPAGTAAALTLRAAGVPVTLLERSPGPRPRPGETLHPGIEPLLDRLGVRESVLGAGYLRHAGHWVEWAGPGQFVPFGHDPRGVWRGFQAPRADFDWRLLSRAARAGTTVRLGVVPRAVCREKARVVGIETSHGPVRARVTVDCTGSAHWLARQLGIPRRPRSPRLVARFGYVTEAAAPGGTLPAIRADATGWTWVAEVEPGRYQWTRVTRPEDRPPRGWRPAGLPDGMPEPTEGADVTWRIARRTAGPGWFLAGDAAAVLDPASSHGVLRALMTGMLAGHLAGRALSGAAPEAACTRVYRAWLSAWFERDAAMLRGAYRAAGLFGYGVGRPASSIGRDASSRVSA